MSSSVNATRVRFDDDNMWVELSDGRTLGVPLPGFPVYYSQVGNSLRVMN